MAKLKIKSIISLKDQLIEEEMVGSFESGVISDQESNNTYVYIDINRNELIRENNELNMKYIFNENELTKGYIYIKELNQDLGIPISVNGNLEKWAKEGVLLLNASLTVRANMAASHAKIGWQRFTDAAIKALSDKKQNLVFILWGNYAIAKENLIDHNKHLILKTVHPSPLSASRGFFGCRHFSKTNEYLLNNNIKPIDWSL